MLAAVASAATLAVNAGCVHPLGIRHRQPDAHLRHRKRSGTWDAVGDVAADCVHAGLGLRRSRQLHVHGERRAAFVHARDSLTTLLWSDLEHDLDEDEDEDRDYDEEDEDEDDEDDD